MTSNIQNYLHTIYLLSHDKILFYLKYFYSCHLYTIQLNTQCIFIYACLLILLFSFKTIDVAVSEIIILFCSMYISELTFYSF